MREFLPADTCPETCLSLAREYTINGVLNGYLSFLVMVHDAGRFRSKIELDGWEHVQEALKRGNGAILLSSHVGIPRLLRWYLRTQDTPVLYVLRIGFYAGPPQNKGERVNRRLRARFLLDDDNLCGQEGLSTQYMKRAYDHLKNNGLVNIAGDGPFGDRRVPVTVRGNTIEFAVGGLALGLMNDAPILPCFTVVGANPPFRIQIQKPLDCPEDLTRSEKLQALADAFAARLDEYINRYPTNVFRLQYRAPIDPEVLRRPLSDTN